MDATMTMSQLNPLAFHDHDAEWHYFIEDVPVDDDWFRIEYRCRPDGSNATAWVRYNPWGDSDPYSYEESHVSPDGFVCIGKNLQHERSPYDLDYAVKKGRFWCMGFSFLMEHGYEATCRELPEWRYTGR